MAKSKQILIIDDNFQILDSVQTLLETSSGEYGVISVPSAEEGMLVLRRLSIDLLVTDIYLPGMSGGELIARVHQLWPQLPIIVITGHAERMNPEDAADAGVVHYFRKPIDPQKFIAAVRSALQAQEAESEPENKQHPSKGVSEFTLAIHSIMEKLRIDVAAREVLLSTIEGHVMYATGGRASALAKFVSDVLPAVRSSVKFAGSTGSRELSAFHYLANEHIELFVSILGYQHFLAILYYAHSRRVEINSIWSSTRKSGEKLLHILLPPDDTKAASDIVEISIAAGEEPSKLVPGVNLEQKSQDEFVPEEEPAGDFLADLMDLEDSIDLDAFWESAAAETPDAGGISTGLTYEEAKKMGLLPSEFDSEEKSGDRP